MRKIPDDRSSRWAKLWLPLVFAAALAGCNGGGSDSATPLAPVDPPDEQTGIEEKGCLEECKKFLAQLVDDFAGKAEPTAAIKKAIAATPRVSGDVVEFDVAAIALDETHSGELNDAFPVSGTELAYVLSVNKATGEITIDNKKGKTYLLKAFDEASYFQDIDYAKTDLADVNKAHYAYVNFNPKEKANVIQKQANLRRQWKLVDGSDQPEPGVSMLIGTHFQDCPGDSACDLVMLTTNPPEESSSDGNPVELGGDKGVTGDVNGEQKKVTGPTAMARDSVGGLISISGQAPMLGGANWSLVIQPKEGAQECNTGGVLIQYTTLGETNAWTSANGEGTCSITVGKLTDTEVAGTFTADLGPGDSNTDKSRRAVTRGAFHLNR